MKQIIRSEIGGVWRRTLLRSVLICITLAYWALLPNFFLIFKAANRLYLLWDRTLHAAIVSAILVLGLFYSILTFLSWLVLRQWPKLRDGIWAVFMVFIFIRTTVSLADKMNIFSEQLQSILDDRAVKFIYYIGLPSLMILFFQRGIVKCLLRFLLITSPILLFIFFIPLSYSSSSKGGMKGLSEYVQVQVAHTNTTRHSKTSVFVFIFDEWSFDRTISSPDFFRLMPNAAEIIKEAVLYTNAYSAGSTTIVSIPRMLFPNNPKVAKQTFSQVRSAVLNHDLSAAEGSIFDIPGVEYTKILSGFYFDYAKLMDGQVDYAVDYHAGRSLRSYWGELSKLLMSQMAWLRYTGLHIPPQATAPAVWYVAQVKVHEDALFTLQYFKTPVFAVFHYCLPHYPYAWAGDGGKKRDATTIYSQTVSNYMDNIERLDVVLGEILKVAKTRNNNYLLIFTSDHAWRCDPDWANWTTLENYPEEIVDRNPSSPFRHVPLILYNGQMGNSGIVGEAFDLGNLHLLIRGYLSED